MPNPKLTVAQPTRNSPPWPFDGLAVYLHQCRRAGRRRTRHGEPYALLEDATVAGYRAWLRGDIAAQAWWHGYHMGVQSVIAAARARDDGERGPYDDHQLLWERYQQGYRAGMRRLNATPPNPRPLTVPPVSRRINAHRHLRAILRMLDHPELNHG